MHGKGRVFYTSMGHREDVWENAKFQGLAIGGLLVGHQAGRGRRDPEPRHRDAGLRDAGQVRARTGHERNERPTSRVMSPGGRAVVLFLVRDRKDR